MKQKDFLSCSVRNWGEHEEQYIHTLSCDKCEVVYLTHPLISELRESVDNDTKHNVQPDGRDDDEKGHIKGNTKRRCPKLLGH